MKKSYFQKKTLIMLCLIYLIPCTLFAKHQSYSSDSESDSESSSEICNCSKTCTTISQQDFPLIIDEPGTYCLDKNLIWSEAGPAITIVADDVCFFGNDNRIKIENPESIALSVRNAKNFCLKELKVEYSSNQGPSTASALTLDYVSNVDIKHFKIENTNYGIRLNGASNVHISKLKYTNPLPCEELAQSSFDNVALFFAENASKHIKLKKSHVENAPGVLSVSNTSFNGVNYDLTVKECHFNHLTWQGLFLSSFKNVKIEDTHFTYVFNFADFPEATGLIRLGINAPTDDVKIQNCKAITDSPDGFLGLPVFISSGMGSNWKIDNCEVESKGVPAFFASFDASIDPSLTIKDVCITNCTAKNCELFVTSFVLPGSDLLKGFVMRKNKISGDNGAFGFSMIGVDGAIIEENEISSTCSSCVFSPLPDAFIPGTLAAIGLYSSCINCKVKDNTISDWQNGPGIYLGNFTMSGSPASYNKVTDNCLENTGGIVDDGLFNKVKDNKVKDSFTLI